MSIFVNVIIRPYSSDLNNFNQIFIQEEYKAVSNLPNINFIVDCGAYVGYSSIYFLNKYPNCFLVAIEPNPHNFKTLQINLRPYYNRVRLINAAVWPYICNLKTAVNSYRDGQEWTKQVEECNEDEKEIDSVTLNDVLNDSDFYRISLLKMDIEGSEAKIFSENLNWLDRTDNIAIEIHDDSEFGNSSNIFAEAVKSRNFNIKKNGETTVCEKMYEYA